MPNDKQELFGLVMSSAVCRSGRPALGTASARRAALRWRRRRRRRPYDSAPPPPPRDGQRRGRSAAVDARRPNRSTTTRRVEWARPGPRRRGRPWPGGPEVPGVRTRVDGRPSVLRDPAARRNSLRARRRLIFEYNFYSPVRTELRPPSTVYTNTI